MRTAPTLPETLMQVFRPLLIDRPQSLRDVDSGRQPALQPLDALAQRRIHKDMKTIRPVFQDALRSPSHNYAVAAVIGLSLIHIYLARVRPSEPDANHLQIHRLRSTGT